MNEEEAATELRNEAMLLYYCWVRLKKGKGLGGGGRKQNERQVCSLAGAQWFLLLPALGDVQGPASSVIDRGSQSGRGMMG